MLTAFLYTGIITSLYISPVVFFSKTTSIIANYQHSASDRSQQTTESTIQKLHAWITAKLSGYIRHYLQLKYTLSNTSLTVYESVKLRVYVSKWQISMRLRYDIVLK